jgi:hypothetical protein
MKGADSSGRPKQEHWCPRTPEQRGRARPFLCYVLAHVAQCDRKEVSMGFPRAILYCAFPARHFRAGGSFGPPGTCGTPSRAII